MDLETLQDFFMWCTIINLALLLFWTMWFTLAPNLIYRIQRPWIKSSQEQFNLVMYCFLGLFKILFLIFNLVPWLALMIVNR